MSQALYIGIDIGTSSVRCCAVDANRQLIASSKADLPLPENPQPGWHEQDAQLWWDKTQVSFACLLEKIDPLLVKSIAVDGTSSTVLLTDYGNQPVSPALMYNDSRASEILDDLHQFVPLDSITLSASSTLAKAVYLLNQSKARHTGRRHITHQADWICSQFSGQPAVSDENNCLKLGYDSNLAKWPDWLKNAPFDLYEKLPAVYPSGTLIGQIEPGIADQFKLSRDTCIITGTTDSTASTLATGIEASGEAVTTYGSTLVMKVVADLPISSVRDGIYSHRLPTGRWLVGGASNSGGNVLLKYFTVDQIKKLSALIDPQQSTGLEYYPLAGKGERFPINDPNLQPRLSPRPKSDVLFLQAMFEGFARIEKLAYDRMTELGAPSPSRIYSAGGQATSNQALTEIRSRILQIPVIKASHTEASYGVALLALNALCQ